ncbi:NADH-quinone oxidoreductase subunit N [Vallicoccus soli]|uniref:NADH-quinone oxidoreductase subunit N n=1 Tax=Vallicoccus soli TaxID=2339232 RepID=A0A3A3Z032_9ACTN|nr:proton-conducting transporter membrane subunit [Vallicoccus soli]RJK97600.1 NADH-quinone oxidoreductase subunit N [Vallicoccus soli]
MEPLALLPEALLLGGALAALLAGSFLPRERQWVARLVAAAALLASSVASAVALAGPARTVFEGTYAVDTATGAARLVVALATLLVLGLGVDELAGDRQESEAYCLLLLSALGAVVVAGADDLLVLAVGFLLASIPLYALVGLARTPAAAEAALKTYLLGALFGITMLLGVTVLYGATGTTSYALLGERLPGAPDAAVALGAVAVVGGLMFKAGGVPGHFWVPDAAQGAGVAAAAFATTVPKVGALVAVLRLVDVLAPVAGVRLLVGLLAAAGMVLGNLAALGQTDPRRLLGWSTVAQVGYLLVPVAVVGRSDLAVPSLLLYLAAYAVTNLAAFAVVAALPARRDLAAYRGLAGARPGLAAALLVALLGLLGTPPTAVFAGKLTTATAAWDGGEPWLAVVVVVTTLLSLGYHLRWFVPAYRAGEPPERADRGAFVPRPRAAAAAAVAAVASVALGVAAGLAWAVADGPLVR